MIDFVKAHIGHDAAIVTLEDIERFFASGQSEKTTLEFKSFVDSGNLDDKIKSLTRSATAFLNSQGGLIIWGAPQEQKVDGAKVSVGPLTVITQELEKDFLLSKITGNIVPTPTGIDLQRLSNDRGHVYLIQIQQSSYSPHQHENRYWMRNDGQTIPAPHHYVEAMFKRIRYPDLRGELLFPQFHYVLKGKGRFDEFYLRLVVKIKLFNNTLFQNEENYAFDLICDNGKPLDFNEKWPPNHHDFPTIYATRVGYELNVLHYGKPAHFNRAIGYDGYDLKKSGNKSKVVLRFGGRYSPLKYSVYEIDFQFLDFLKQSENESYKINPSFVSASENLLVSDSPISSDELAKWKQRDD